MVCDVLPLEIVEQILDELFLDYRTLKACTLAERSWTARCQRYLFHHLVIRSTEDSKRFFDSLQTLPHRPSLIREAQLLDGPWRQEVQAWFYGERGLDRLLPMIMENVQILKLQFLNFSQIGPVAKMCFHRQQGLGFSSLEKLTLSRCSFFSYHTFITLVCAVTSLKHLYLDGPLWIHPEEEASEPNVPQMRLHTLEFGELRLSPFPHTVASGAIARRISTETVETLIVHATSFPDHVFFEGIVFVIGPYLRHLQVYLDLALYHEFCRSISRLTGLHTVALLITFPFDYRGVVSPPGLLRLGLQAVTSTQLESSMLALQNLHSEADVVFPVHHCADLHTVMRKLLDIRSSFKAAIAAPAGPGVTRISEGMAQNLGCFIDGGALRVMRTSD